MRFNVEFRGTRTTVRVNSDVWELFVYICNAGSDEAARASFLTYFKLHEGVANCRGLSNQEAAHEVCKNLIYSCLRGNIEPLHAGESARNSRAPGTGKAPDTEAAEARPSTGRN